MENKIAIVDIETTGFLKQHGLIVEIGIVELDLDNGEIKPLYSELVKEGSFGEEHKGSWIFQNSSLKFEDVMQAKGLDYVKVQEILLQYHATAFNKSFDFDFLRDRGFKIKELPCPMKELTPICKLPGRRGDYKWPKVQEAWDFLFPNSGYIEEHRGFDDAKHEAELVYWLHKNNKCNYTPKEIIKESFTDSQNNRWVFNNSQKRYIKSEETQND